MTKQFIPSYLEVLEDKVNSYTFTKLSVMTLRDMVKQQLGNTLNPKFISNHRKELKVYHFALEVSDKYKKWKIIKRLPEFIQLEKHLKSRYEKVPSIPVRREQQINSNNEEKILQFLSLFMQLISNIQNLTQEKQFLKFIENFVPPERKKMKSFKQISLKKKAGGRHNQSSFKKLMTYFINWTEKYFTITSEGVYYTASHDDFRIQEMIPFTNSFKILYGEAQTGQTYGIMINSDHRILNVDAENIFKMTYFVYFIRKAMKESKYLQVKRYHSFADIRSNCSGKYYIDGRNYFSDLYEALRQAKSEIYITGWMVSPYFCLKRPDPENQTRLDKLFQKIANLGIKINIIIYMEPKVALNIDSEFTENYLMSLSSNIKVLRHPAYVLIPFLWSHHEKMVIIDQKVAFLGGLDLGYGRFDDNLHLLTDVNQQIWYGVDYCNYRKTDILKPKQYLKSSIDRQKQARMPWHDVAVKIKGDSVIDLSRHFVQYWNYVNFQLNMDERQLLMYAGLHEEQLEQIKQNDMNRFSVRKVNDYRKSINTRIHSQPININFQRESRMLSLIDSQQLNLDHEQEMEFYATHLKTQKGGALSKLFNKIKERNFSGRQGINIEDLVVTETQENADKGNQKHQLLRSASMWSLGLNQGQQQISIHQAYVELIFNSKEFIYIQNQFFISVQNNIAKALIQRISRAYENKEKFKVVVVLPCLPGFDGEIQNQVSAVMRVQVHHIYNTICRGGKSILQQLSFIPNLNQYIQFFCLRTHAELNGVPVTQIVYVHSKLMIVDDEKVLIGSANINDRSLLGSRDSEIAIVIEDQQVKQIQVGIDKKRNVKKFAHFLRVELFLQHFGLKRQEVQDYHNQEAWWSMIQHADKNQQIYRQVFGVYPDNSMRNYKDIEKVFNSRDPSKYGLLKELIKGNAIQFQMHFLDQQNLDLKASQKQYYVPSINFT